MKHIIFLITISLLAGCAIFEPSPQERAELLRATATEMLRELPTDINQQSEDTMYVNPLLAAILFDPERVPDLLQAGATATPHHNLQKPNGYYIAPLRLALNRAEFLQNWWGIEADPQMDLVLTELLLSTGEYKTGFTCTLAKAYVDAELSWSPNNSAEANELATKKMELLYVKHGGFSQNYSRGKGNTLPVCTRKDFKNYVISASRQRGPIQDPRWWPFYEVRIKHYRLQDMDEEERLAYYAKENKNEDVKKIIVQNIAADNTLKEGLMTVVNLGKDCETISSIWSRLISFSCHTYISGSGNFTSESCESAKKQLTSKVGQDMERFCGIYDTSRKQFAAYLGDNASAMYSLLEDKLEEAGLNSELAAPYNDEIAYVAGLKDREIRGEKAAIDRATHQRMLNLINHTDKAFSSRTEAEKILIETDKRNTRIYKSIIATNRQMELEKKLKELGRTLDNIDKNLALKGAADKDRTSAGGDSKSSPRENPSPEIVTRQPEGGPKVCAGPFTMPAIDRVVDAQERNKGIGLNDYQCPEGTNPVQEGAYSATFTNWLLPGPDSEPLGNGKSRVTRKAFDYVCLCESGKTGTGSTQQ